MADHMDFETAKVRILILCQYFPEYSKALIKTIDYAKDDPSAGLLKCRQILEDVCKTIWNKYNDSIPPSIYDIFNDNKIKNDTPKRILNRVHSLRSICNLGVHGEEVTQDDVLISLNHLFVVFDWYNVNQKHLSPLPVAIEASHGFSKYIRHSIKSKFLLLLVFSFILIPACIFSYHKLLPTELSRPFKAVYEGVFDKGFYLINGFSFSIIYSTFLVVLTLILAWSVFKRFRDQNNKSRIISFVLMYFTMFGLQYFSLHVLDFYTRIF
jgi:hypothetical protein